MLRALGEKYGFDVDQLPPVEVGGHVVSSTCLRELIGKGDVATAASLLGHAYGCEGLVVHGEGRGTGLGFPTANIAIPDTMLPAPGVYATRVVVPHLGKTLQAVTNIGRKPTFGDYGLSIESFLLDTDLNLYGSELRLDFVARLQRREAFRLRRCPGGPDPHRRGPGPRFAEHVFYPGLGLCCQETGSHGHAP